MTILKRIELLEAKIKKLAKNACCSLKAVNIDDDAVDDTRVNTIQILNNGEVWIVDSDGNAIQLTVTP